MGTNGGTDHEQQHPKAITFSYNTHFQCARCQNKALNENYDSTTTSKGMSHATDMGI